MKKIQLAAMIRPGFAISGSDLLDLTVKAYEQGENLTGVEIRNASPCNETGGFWVEGGNENKHFSENGKIDN